MKTNELRIGNYLDARNKTYGNKLSIIEKIDNMTHLLFNPITLNEEWLLKFGFKIVNKSLGSYIKGEFTIEDFDSEYVFRWNGFNINTNLKYVHQLQNLYFALTNEELLDAKS